MEEAPEMGTLSHELSDIGDDTPHASSAVTIVMVVLAPLVGYAFMRFGIEFVDDTLLRTLGGGDSDGTTTAHSLGIYGAVVATLFVVALRAAIHSVEREPVTPAPVPSAAKLPPLAEPVASPATPAVERAPQPVG